MKRAGAALPEDKASQGQQLVTRFQCVQCHGPTLKGQQHIPRLAGQQPNYLKTQLEGFKAQTRFDKGRCAGNGLGFQEQRLFAGLGDGGGSIETGERGLTGAAIGEIDGAELRPISVEGRPARNSGDAMAGLLEMLDGCAAD